MLLGRIIILLVILGGCSGLRQQVEATTSTCVLSNTDIRWMQDILDGWTLVTRSFLDLEPAPLPWTVLFDASCTWHLAPDEGMLSNAKPVDTPLTLAETPVPVYVLPHEGQVQLPNGALIPADIMAAAFPYSNGAKAFFALALPALWHRHPHASQDPHLEIRIFSVAFHEMIHTRQLPTLTHRIRALEARYVLPAQFDDDVIENRFKEVAGYKALFEEERDLFYRVVAEADPARRDSLIALALAKAGARQSQFFTGADAGYAELEALFLNMEGVAEWVRFKFHQADPRWPSADADILFFLRGRANNWSQDEGLALVLLLNEMVPDWKRRILGPDMASPFALLREAVAESSEKDQ